MKKFRLGGISAIAILTGSTLAFAATKKTDTAAADKAAEDAVIASIQEAQMNYGGITAESYAAFQKQPDSKFDRKIASSGANYEKEMSDDYKAMGDRIRMLKDADALAALVAEMDRDYDKYQDADLKLLALEMAQLKPMRGLIFRLIPLAERAKVTHSVLLTRLMKIATRMGMYSPTNQAKVVLSYLSEPYNGMVRFRTPRDFQNFVGTEVYSATWKSALRLRDLDLTQRKDKSKKKLLIDSSIFYSGIGGFYDDNARFNFFQEGERQLLMAMKNRTMKDQLAFISFNVEKLMDLSMALGKLYGIETFRENIEGVSTKAIHDVIMQDQFKDLFVMKERIGAGVGCITNTTVTDGSVKPDERCKQDPGHAGAMAMVAFHTRQMVWHLGQAWKALRDDRMKIDHSGIINPAVANAFNDRIEDVLPVWEKLIAGPQPLVSKMTSEMTTVDVPGYYESFKKTSGLTSADQAARDLKNFLPTQFHITPPNSNCKEGNRIHVGIVSAPGLGTHDRVGMLSKKVTYTNAEGKQVTEEVCYRDYFYGAPTGWNPLPYSILYPGLTDGKKVGENQRILKQSNGGRLVANLIDWVID
ncbi:MAG: hypothetical protein JST04_09960 [Bdellovibrionales bacterium]|nr:hypothetical protein [Bdellovibrionales bacterium]